MGKKPLALPRGRTLLLEEVKQLTGFGKSAIYYRNKVGHKYYDATFPPRIQRGNSTAVGWDEQALLAWLEARPLAERRDAVKKTSSGDEGRKAPKPRKVVKAALTAAMKAVLVETVQRCKTISHYEFVLAVRRRLERDEVDVQERLLDEIDRKAYAKHNVLPTLVIQERGNPVREGWYRSALNMRVGGDSYHGHYQRLFLATLARAAPRPIRFRWIEGRGYRSVTPIYSVKPAAPPRPSPDPAALVAAEARYAKLLPERYVPGRGTNRGTRSKA